jgi:cobalt-zinc-cadmium efflux system outer membrane protein
MSLGEWDMVRTLFLSLILLGAPVVALAQEGHLPGATERPVEDGPPLTLRGAIDEALAHNPTLIALRKQFEAARQRSVQERFLMPPTLEAQIWQWPVTAINPLDTNMYMFTIQQDVPGRGKRALRTALAEKDTELAAADIAMRARDVVKDVARAYADLALARKAIEIHLQSVALLRQFADASTIQYAAGRSSQRDVLTSVVELSRLHEELIMHEETAASAAARLNTLLDRDPQTPIGPLDRPRDAIVLPASEVLQQLAIEHQPDLHAAGLAKERAGAAVAAAKADAKPDFMIGGGYMLMPREAGAWTASVGVTWPNAPWSRGRIAAATAAAAADVDAANARIRAREREVRLAVHDAYVRVRAANERVALLQTAIVPPLQQALAVSRVAYATDRVDVLAVIDSQRALLDAQLSCQRALGERELALADLARAVGTDLPVATEIE